MSLQGRATNDERRAARAGATKTRAVCVCALVVACVLSPGGAASAQTSAQTARVEGVVLDEAGAPVVAAEVSLSVRAAVVSEATTNAEGQFAFDAVRAREGTLSVRAVGFAGVEQRWRVGAGETTRVRVVLAPAPLSEQVSVTATRTATRTGETAASVVVMGAEELETTAAVRLDDALRQVAGFSLFRRAGSRTANPTAQGVSLRGVGASGASRAVVLADGVPLNDPFGGWVYWGRVPRSSVGRVEVLRGGASSLYGSGALGGVVNITTRRPAADAALSLELSYGNEGTPDAALFLSGRRAGWAATLGAELFHTDGYVLVDERERGRADTLAGARSSVFDLTLERSLAGDGRVFMRGALFGESRTNGTPLQTNRTHIRQLSAGLDWQRPSAGAFIVRGYGGAEIFDQNFTAVAADRNSETLTRVQRVPAQVRGLSAQWSRAFGSRQTLVAGLEAREVRGASDEIVYAQGRATSLVGAGGRERTVGLFVEDILRVTPRLIVTGGVRADSWRNYAATNATRSLTRPNAPAAVTRFADRRETAISPQLSVLYKLTDNVSLAASAYRAFRQPTLNELYRSFRVGDVLTLANENLRAERLTGGEAGASATTFKGRLDVRGTLFWSELERPVANVTLSVAPSLITRQRQNLGRTRSSGVELETEARLNNRWTLSGGYTLAASVVESFPANTSLEGLRVPQVARHQLTFQMRYTNPARLTFAVQGRAASSQFDDDQNRFRLDPYFTLDAYASRRFAHGLEFFAAAENLLNQRYDIGRTPVRTLSPPLLMRAGVRLRLGSK